MAHRPLLTRRAVGGCLAGAAAICLAALSGCSRADARGDEGELRVWAFGAEGEALAPIAREFEQANPGVHVRVQAIPWTAAHEKLLTAFVGGALPDVAQLGNTWIPEFAALNALEPLDALVAHDSALVPRTDYFPGVLATNVVDSVLYGVPWYVDTRVMFYRTDLMRAAGITSPPTTWASLRDALIRVKKVQPAGGFPILMPLNEWTQPVIFGMQAGSPLLADHGTRGAFEDAPFRRGFEFYISLFQDSLAPALANTQISSVYQEFAAGRMAVYITGPWNVGEFKKRLPDSLQRAWMTAPMPGPDSAGISLAGGSSIVIMRRSTKKAAAWRFVTFMSDPARQARFYERTGDLPARRSAWAAPALASDPYLAAFRTQLARVVPTPAVPEAELIMNLVAEAGERAARNRQTIDQALASLDHEVDAVLEKRRWLMSQHLLTTDAPRPRR
ncbi:MAG TPA: sugar ABC transporter substrate-binding protein [Acidimicrobiia bacterium]|nr:sugar ABC transporter substrate-binding protein [Acidimicrobiia bacterium]